MYLLFDIGGTKTRIGFSSDGENLSDSKTSPTPQSFEDFITLLKETASSSGINQFKGCAGGIRGVLNKNKTELAYDTILAHWVGKPLKQSVEDIFKVPVFLENDAALAALGEANKGTGKGYKIVSYITVSTGVGGAKVVEGKLEKQVFGFEPGHQIISPDGLELEQYVSGTALKQENGVPPEQITDPAIWDEAARRLAIGLNNTILYWSPEIIVLGGGLMHKLPLERVKIHLSQIHKMFPEIPEIALAKLGEVAGLNGALIYLKQNLAA